jgi:hypothetical protein
MIESDKREFQEIVLATAELYSMTKKVEVTPVMLKLFYSALREFAIEQVIYGFQQHLRDPVDGKFFPKPANIIKHLQVKEISPEEKAELAWAQIQDCIRKNGTYGNLDIDDKQAIAAVKAFTTWKELCALPVDRQTWAKKEFISMYTTYENTPLESLPFSLPGMVDLYNHKKKYAEIGAKSAAEVTKELMNRMKEGK